MIRRRPKRIQFRSAKGSPSTWPRDVALFFEYVRDKKWDSVASYLDRKSVLYSGRGALNLNVSVYARM